MTVFDQVEYHGHHCTVEAQWDDERGHHILALRPYDNPNGLYFADEADCKAES